MDRMVNTKKKISEKVSLASYLIFDVILYVLNKITTKEKTYEESQ
jgi:hypothetical protein